MAVNTWHLPSKYYEHIFVSGLHPVPPFLPKKEKLGKGTGVGTTKNTSLENPSTSKWTQYNHSRYGQMYSQIDFHVKNK